MNREQIRSILPGLDCGQCGHQGCDPYAEALAQGQASIDRCPPGGREVLEQLAMLSKEDPNLYWPDLSARMSPVQTAWIDPNVCIGCGLCLPACPVDAIAGASQHLHQVLTSECNGCMRCIRACPVDCIVMQNSEDARSTRYALREHYRMRQENKKAQQTEANAHPRSELSEARKRRYIASSMMRVRQRGSASQSQEPKSAKDGETL